MGGQAAAILAQIRPPAASPRGRVFARMPTYRRVLNNIREASIERDDGTGTVSFQSFRVTLGTRLARNGVAPQIAQKILRHADISTTMKYYTKLRIEDATAGVEKLPFVGEITDAESSAA